MTAWIKVTTENALANGEHLNLELDGTEVAVFKLDNQFYAIEDECTHDGGELACGEIAGDEIICPRHGARFCIKTGIAKSAPAYEDIHCFPLKLDNGILYIRDDR